MNRIVVLLQMLLGALSFMILPSCDYEYIEPIKVEIPDTVSFQGLILPIFEDNCAKSGCHVSGGVAPDLSSEDAHDNLWLYNLVDTTEPTSSILYERISSESSPMPPTGRLTNDKIKLILAWIEQGAKNN